MEWKKKIRFFCDYYLMKTLAILAGLFVIFYFVKVIGFDRKEVVLSVLLLNESEEYDIDQMEAELKKYLGFTSEKQDITFAFLRTDISQNEAIIMTRIRAKSVDLIVSDEKTFDRFVRGGIYKELSSVLSGTIKNQFPEKVFSGSIEILNEHGSVIGEEKNGIYGWNLAENEKYVTLGSKLEKPVLGLVSNAMNMENAEKAIGFFAENE